MENDGNTIVSRLDISRCVFDELIGGGSLDWLVRNFVETLRTAASFCVHAHRGTPEQFYEFRDRARVLSLSLSLSLSGRKGL